MIRRPILALILLAAISGHNALTAQNKNTIWWQSRVGQIDRVRAMLDADPSLLNAIDGDKRTPLHLASRWGHLDIVKLLLDRGAKPDEKAYNRFTPLYMAVSFNRPQILDLLLQQDVNLDHRTSFGRTVLDIAAQNNRKQLVERLLQAGASYTMFTGACHGDKERVAELLKDAGVKVSRATMLQAIRRGHAEVAALMLPRYEPPRFLVNLQTNHPLLFPATAHVDVVRALITAGEDPDERCDGQGASRIEHGASVLHVAASKGHLETVSYLLSLDEFAAPDVISRSNRTPAHEAAANGHLTTLQMLHKHGAKLVAADKRGRTCVHFAAEAGHSEVLRWLVAQGRVLHGRDEGGRSALAIATKSIHPTEKRVKQRIEAAWELVRHGVRVDLSSAAVIGDTASAKAILAAKPELAKTKGLLVRAISFGHKDIVALLLDAGCDVNVVDERKTSALHWTAMWRQAACTQLLLDRGADVHAVNKFGYTPLHDAARANCAPVAKVLLAAGAKLDAKDKKGKVPRDYLNSYASKEIRALLK